MSVIAEISVSSDEFALGRVMDLSPPETAELESLVPAGDRPVPYFWLYEADFDAFEEAVLQDPAVDRIEAVDVYEDRVLYTVEWSVENDAVLRAIREVDASLLSATGSGGTWEFELRFSSHEELSSFRDHCRTDDVGFEVHRVYNPAQPEVGAWYGLTDRQREALELAVNSGYYNIPRDCTTIDIADELDISDQAVTERLRRAISTLTVNTVLTNE